MTLKFIRMRFNTLWIYTALKRIIRAWRTMLCFNTLWIYTALKQVCSLLVWGIVSIPSEFTLLSNAWVQLVHTPWFQYPLNLHCSQTVPRSFSTFLSFNTLWIYTALKPESAWRICRFRFNTLWIYTALKPKIAWGIGCMGFNTLWIYTALKLPTPSTRMPTCFNTLWIYTALKLRCQMQKFIYSFNTLWIYTALKLRSIFCRYSSVSIPSEFTLLSNNAQR